MISELQTNLFPLYFQMNSAVYFEKGINGSQLLVKASPESSNFTSSLYLIYMPSIIGQTSQILKCGFGKQLHKNIFAHRK